METATTSAFAVADTVDAINEMNEMLMDAFEAAAACLREQLLLDDMLMARAGSFATEPWQLIPTDKVYSSDAVRMIQSGRF